jgi:hypothetical protein
MESSVFYGVVPCSPLKFSLHFGAICQSSVEEEGDICLWNVCCLSGDYMTYPKRHNCSLFKVVCREQYDVRCFAVLGNCWSISVLSDYIHVFRLINSPHSQKLRVTYDLCISIFSKIQSKGSNPRRQYIRLLKFSSSLRSYGIWVNCPYMPPIYFRCTETKYGIDCGVDQQILCNAIGPNIAAIRRQQQLLTCRIKNPRLAKRKPRRKLGARITAAAVNYKQNLNFLFPRVTGNISCNSKCKWRTADTWNPCLENADGESLLD